MSGISVSDNEITFNATGRRVYVNGGIIGLSPDGFVFGGYDNDLFSRESLTDSEARDLALVMIAKWCEFGLPRQLPRVTT